MPITFLNGVKMFGESTMDPLVSAVVGGTVFSKSFRLPVSKTTMDIFSSALRMPGFMRMFLFLGKLECVLGDSSNPHDSLTFRPLSIGSPMAWADFLYHFVVDLIYRAVRAAYNPETRPESVFYATMYDFKQEFEVKVATNMHRAYTGISLAFGYTNPWARVIRTQCDAWASVPGGMLTFTNGFLVEIPIAHCLCKLAQVSIMWLRHVGC